MSLIADSEKEYVPWRERERIKVFRTFEHFTVNVNIISNHSNEYKHKQIVLG